MSPRACPAGFPEGRDGTAGVSLYAGDPATPGEVAVAMARLRAAFPRMAPEFFNLLAERVVERGFTAARLRDAVNETLDGFRYRELSIADIIGYDRRLRLYSYKEVAALVTRGEAEFSDFAIREFGGVAYRVRKADIDAGGGRIAACGTL